MSDSAEKPDSPSVNRPPRVGQLGDAGVASVPLSPAPEDISLYEEGEWTRLSETTRAAVIVSIKSEFDSILEEVESIGDGAAEESISLRRNKNIFKLALIILTGLIALTNFFGSTFTTYSTVLAFGSGVIAITVATLGSIDSYFSFSERSLKMMELHYRCRSIATNLKSRWAAATIDAADFKTYSNSFRALDAAQREIQQINKLAEQIMHDGEGKSATGTS